MPVATLTVNLTAQTASFQNAMKKASKFSVDSMADITKAMKVIGPAMAAAGAAVVGSLAVMTKNAINTADNFAKMSERTGVAVENLSALSYVADLSGVKMESFEAALVKLNRTIADAASGAGEAADLFKSMGVEIFDGGKQIRDTDKIFLDIADHIAGLGDISLKTEKMVKAMGKSAAELLPAMNQGKAGIVALMQEAQRLGVTWDTKTAKAAERFNDNLTRMQAQLSAVGVSLATALLPSLNALSDKLLDINQDAEKARAMAEGVTVAFNVLATAAITSAYSLAAVGAVIKRVAAAYINLSRGEFRAAIDNVKNINKEIVDTVKEGVKLASSLWSPEAQAEAEKRRKAVMTSLELQTEGRKLTESLRSASEKYNDEVKRYGELLKAGAISQEVYNRALKRAGEEMAAAQRKAGGLRITFEQTVRAVSEIKFPVDRVLEYFRAASEGAQRVFAETRTPLEQLTQNLAELNRLYDLGALSLDTYARAAGAVNAQMEEAGKLIERQVKDLPKLITPLDIYGPIGKGAEQTIEATRTAAEKYSQRIGELNQQLAVGAISQETYQRAVHQAAEEMKRAERATDDLKSASKDFAHVIGTAFEDALVNLKGIRSIMAGLLQDIARIIARITITKPLERALEGLFSGSGSKSGGSVFNLPGVIKNLFGGFRHSGGPVLPGRLYNVLPNEEIFTPTVAGRVTPASKMGGQTVILNIDARGAAPGVENNFRRMLPEIEDRIVRRVFAVQSRVAFANR